MGRADLGRWSQLLTGAVGVCAHLATQLLWHHKGHISRVVFFFLPWKITIIAKFFHVYVGDLWQTSLQKTSFHCSVLSVLKWWTAATFQLQLVFVGGGRKGRVAEHRWPRWERSCALLNRELSRHYTVGRVCPLSLLLPWGGHYTRSRMPTPTCQVGWEAFKQTHKLCFF